MPLAHYSGTHCKICGKPTSFWFGVLDVEVFCDKHQKIELRKKKLKQIQNGLSRNTNKR